MTPEEEAHPPSAGRSDILPAGSITVSYRYGPGEAANTELIRGGLFLPLVGREGQALGALALFWRTPRFEPPQERIAALEEIAGACIPAIENARRYREARRQSETDALTGFFNQRYFHETLRREAQRAQQILAQAGPPDPRLRRLQARQRPGRPPGRRRRPGPGRRPPARSGPLGRHRLPHRRRRVRRHPPRVDRDRCAAALRSDAQAAVETMTIPGGRRCGSQPESQSYIRARPPRASSSAQIPRCTGRRSWARTVPLSLPRATERRAVSRGMRDGRLAPSASSTVTLTVAPRQSRVASAERPRRPRRRGPPAVAWPSRAA